MNFDDLCVFQFCITRQAGRACIAELVRLQALKLDALRNGNNIKFTLLARQWAACEMIMMGKFS